MRQALRGAALLLLAMLVMPGISAQDKKDTKKDNKDSDTPKKDSNLVKAGTITGTIVTSDEAKKTIRLRVDKYTLNAGAVQNLQNAKVGVVQRQQELAQAQVALTQALARAPNDSGKPSAIQSAQQGILQARQNVANAQNAAIQAERANMYNKSSEEAELTCTDDVIVRLHNPPPKIDDKGKQVKHTAKELAELKGNKNLPGYTGEFSELRSNMIVTLHLVAPKNVGKPKINPKTKEIDPDFITDNRPKISMIVVLGEPKQPGQ